MVLNLLQRTTSSLSSVSRRTTDTGNGSLVTLRPVVLLVPLRFSSSTRSITHVPVSPTTPSLQRVEVLVNSTVSWMSTKRPSLLMALLVSTVASSRPSSVSSFTEVFSVLCHFHCRSPTHLHRSFGVYDSLSEYSPTDKLCFV